MKAIYAKKRLIVAISTAHLLPDPERNGNTKKKEEIPYGFLPVMTWICFFSGQFTVNIVLIAGDCAYIRVTAGTHGYHDGNPCSGFLPAFSGYRTAVAAADSRYTGLHILVSDCYTGWRAPGSRACRNNRTGYRHGLLRLWQRNKRQLHPLTKIG